VSNCGYSLQANRKEDLVMIVGPDKLAFYEIECCNGVSLMGIPSLGLTLCCLAGFKGGLFAD
jgi:hypothetical protein